MRNAVRAIIINDDKLIVMHRNKFGMEYETLIGGGVDMGETLEQALLREIQEETGVEITNPRLVFVEEAGAPYGTQHVFVCDYVSGEPALSPNAEEAKIHAMGQNLFQPMWRPLSELNDVTFRSEPLRRAILNGVKNGFPAEPLDITHS